ncbi:glutathione S-transferase theta-1 [Aplysia californica]|uniref:Glutathione S-transferase theta-1 n=1 Tax=Aplysia californica TaxID=6500 RepID=A0ABM0ZVC3_APLCA|nr:glutathione S-transferase theta-1 [Aplysia californica]
MDKTEETTVTKPVHLYLVRISPPCRIVWLYMLQHDIPHQLIDVDFNQARPDLPDAIKGLPHLEVPIMIHRDNVVFEAPAILQYLAREFTGHLGFGPGQQVRLLSESLVSWACGELHRCIGYNYVYPQFLERYALPDHEANEAMVEFSLNRVTTLLETLEKRYLQKSPYLTGQRVTIADSAVATVLVQLQWPGFSFKLWPNVLTWLHRVEHVDFWDTVHQVHSDFLGELLKCRYKFE